MRTMKTATILLSLVLLESCFAPPVTQNKDKEHHNEDDEVGGLEDYMEYHRYLKEVVNALESDPDFRKKLEKAEEHDIRSGKIAEELEFVSHHVRTRLDEIKRVELNRLRELTERKRQLQENIDMEDPTHRHLDHSNPHTFEIDDLKKLIAKTTEDLAEADRKRRDEFKQYELQKEYEKQYKLNHTNGDEREKLEREFKEREEKHKKHEKLHEPGHKAQLEEVWQEQDQMQQEFDPKTFFMLHDLDSNGLWDQDEVKALFIKELEKMYAAGEPEDDMRERAEEMERMRESVFKEVDLNRDGFIDYQEFLAQTKRNDFQQDHGWQALDEKKLYTDEELEYYIRQHQANQMAYGQQQFHPGQIPQQHPQQLPGHLPELNTNEIYPNQPHYRQAGNFHPQQPPQGYQQQQQHPQGYPQQGYHPQQPPQGYQQPQQHPQGYHPQQVPQGNYQQPPNHNQQPPQGLQQPPNHNQQPPQGLQQPPNPNQQPPQGLQQPPSHNQQNPQQVAPGGYQQQQQQMPQHQLPSSTVVNQQQQVPSQQPPNGNNIGNSQGSPQVNKI